MSETTRTDETGLGHGPASDIFREVGRLRLEVARLTEANARLIAAAPDMAAELAALIAHVEGINRAFYVEGTSKALKAAMEGQRERLQAARAAIAKAKGE